MKAHLKESTARLRGRAEAVVVGLLLLFPSSASVLCIPHNGYVSIQDINAACHIHAHFAVHSPGANPSETGFAEATADQDCTDRFITPNGNGAVLVLTGLLVQDSPAHAAPENPIALHASFFTHPSVIVSTHWSGIDKKITSLDAVFSSVPMRC